METNLLKREPDESDSRCSISRCISDGRAHPTDAGADLRSKESHQLWSGMQHLFDTGVAVQIPKGYVGLVFNRSSQGKIGIVIANGTGVIDSDYRGTIKVLLKNTGTTNYNVTALDTRIAQLVIVPIVIADFVEHLDNSDWNGTTRGEGGFGSTGT